MEWPAHPPLEGGGGVSERPNKCTKNEFVFMQP